MALGLTRPAGQRRNAVAVSSRALAEDIPHDAFVRSLDKADTIRDGDSASAWFYRVLRNAVIDHARRGASANRRLETFAHELEVDAEENEAMSQVCQCVSRLADTLKPEYAEAVRRIEVGEGSRVFARSHCLPVLMSMSMM